MKAGKYQPHPVMMAESALGKMGMQQENGPGEIATEPARILAIDDDDLTLAIMRRLLEAENYLVDTTTSAADALVQLQKNPYDAILCDMWLGSMNGREFYQQLKEECAGYQNRLIFVTGDLASEATWEFIDERHLPYILKPFNRSDLLRKVRDIVGERAPAPAPVGPVPSVEPGGERRRYRRIPMNANIRVRKKKWAVGGPDIGEVANVSKGGVFFFTERPYRVGTEVWVTFPFKGYDDLEEEGFIVRVEELANGRRGVATALGEEAAAARTRFEGSQKDARRHHILGAPDSASFPAGPPGSGQPAPDASDTGSVEVHRLGKEIAELRSKQDAVIDQRDQLAAEEAKLHKQLQELTAAKQSMIEVLDHLKTQMLSLQDEAAVSEKYRFQASHDALTGLWNRGAILEILKRELLRTQREGTQLGVIMADLDHFKQVNDTYGHLAGDAVLREAAQRIQAAVRSYDSVGRYGGEEFLIILPGCEEDTATQAERIRQLVGAEPITTEQGPILVTASLGVAWSDGLHGVEEIIHLADEALYCAKREGRNRVAQATENDRGSLPTF
ncbi:MAG: diguanylate cyclase [Acidobacteria bacterium]|nr:diguanylate cyclase [Acidobacteriota bacterium]